MHQPQLQIGLLETATVSSATQSSPRWEPEVAAEKFHRTTSSLAVEADMEGGFKLPIEDTATQELRRLCIQFFSSHFDRMMLVQRPQRRDPAFKQAVYCMALHNPVYCLTVVANAQMDNITNDNVPFEPASDRLTDLVYTRLLEKTRKKVESFEIGDVDVLLLAVVALCEDDLRLDKYDALRSHRAGMSVLVSRRGGAHNLGLSLPDVLQMDRFLAVRLNQLPQFTPTVLPSSDPIMRQSASELPYGFRLHNWSTTLSDEVLSLCRTLLNYLVPWTS